MGRHEQRQRTGVCVVRDPRRAVPRWPWLLPPLGLALLPVGVVAGLFAVAVLLMVVGAGMRYGLGGVRIEGSALPEWQAAEAALREVRLRWPALGAMAEPADIRPTLDITRYNLARLIAARVRLRANLDELRATRKDLAVAGYSRDELHARRDDSDATELHATRDRSGDGGLRARRDDLDATELRARRNDSGAAELRDERRARRDDFCAGEVRDRRDDPGAGGPWSRRREFGGRDMCDELDERIEAAEDRLRDLGAQLAARTAALGRLAASLDAYERREVATARARVLLAGDMPGATLLADPLAEVGERTAATLAAYRELSELRPAPSERCELGET